jgi:hypothetical protein
VIDPTRTAAAVLCEELASIASNLASRLRGSGELPPVVVGRLLVQANRMATKLARHANRLQPPKDPCPRTPYDK